MRGTRGLKIDRQAETILLATPAGREWIAMKLREKRAASARRKARPLRAVGTDKAAQRAERNARAGEIREAVFARAGVRCEAYFAVATHDGRDWQRCSRVPEIWDHWRGGNGRRRAEESVETTWALCVQCNEMRTTNWPNAGYWNDSHRAHCAAHGLRFQPHYDARAAARREEETTP